MVHLPSSFLLAEGTGQLLLFRITRPAKRLVDLLKVLLQFLKIVESRVPGNVLGNPPNRSVGKLRPISLITESYQVLLQTGGSKQYAYDPNHRSSGPATTLYLKML